MSVYDVFFKLKSGREEEEDGRGRGGEVGGGRL